MKKILWLAAFVLFLAACAEESPTPEETAPELADNSSAEETFTEGEEKSATGQEIFEANCTSCHKACGTLIGPDLHGVQERWGNDSALFAFIKNSQKVIADGHARANEVFRQYNEQIMTPQMLDDKQITAVLEYIERVDCSK